MPHDLVIPGGTLHDGTGAPGQTGEVAVVRGEVMRARSGRVIRSA
jgi:N-acyl-D-aspartate/D-glutamate deacylase